METREIHKQMLDVNKRRLDDTFNALIKLQDQTEKFAMGFVDKSTWFPAEGKKALSEWVRLYKQGVEELKSVTNKNYKMMADFFNTNRKEETQGEMEAGEETALRSRRNGRK